MLLADFVNHKIVKLTDTVSNKKLSLVELATFTSGLPKNFRYTDYDMRGSPFAQVTLKNARKFIRDPINMDESGRFHYSNVSIVALAEYLQQVGKQDYRDLLDKRILKPLGLFDTKFIPSPSQKIKGYQDGASVSHWDFEGVFASAGGLWSTPKDMARLLDKITSPPKGLDFIGTSLTTRFESKDQTMGLGWFKLNGGRIVFAAGETAGFSSVMIFSGKSRFGVYLLINESHTPVFDLALQLYLGLL